MIWDSKSSGRLDLLTFSVVALFSSIVSDVTMMHNCTCRTDHIPDKESVREDTDGDLLQALYKERHVFLAYFTSFIVIGKYVLIIVCTCTKNVYLCT